MDIYNNHVKIYNQYMESKKSNKANTTLADNRRKEQERKKWDEDMLRLMGE